MSGAKQLCVYASSSDAVAEVYVEAARQLGWRLAEEGYELIYGAGGIGLMGVVARAVHQRGGRMLGVIPQKLHDRELAYEAADELVITESMRARKGVMEERADAFVALPGGIGTLEEVMEVIVLKQLGYHARPIVFLNVDGFYDALLRFLDDMIARHFLKPSQRELWHVAGSVDEVFDYLAAYAPPVLDTKWFDRGNEMDSAQS